ncbi:PREDICTED: uncharacterized protein LOC104605971 [Nelumbo nucifera]|uniref:PUM-HD domain-containing protein n=2 Tax=Nelumbo nucifera TaxID=4432 RepID=A0A822XK51_NELNU|nr:PREDICTED: uncharacterized protein LOC104605971 [Nelumbo nucifera]DAD21934.1 TPA_asm: hypothetical protein HUJ06_023397 [Nelumbo nucifera]
MKGEEELEKLLNEIPHATSLNLLNLLHQQNHHVPVHGGHCHGSTTKTIHGVYGMYEDDPSCYHKYTCASPVSGVSLQSQGSSSSSSFSGGLSSPDDGSPTPPPLEEIKSQVAPRNTHYPNVLWPDSKFLDSPAAKKADENLMDELSLSGDLSKMHIRDDQEVLSMNRAFQREPYSGFWYNDHSPVRRNHGNVEKNNGSFEGCTREISDYGDLNYSGSTAQNNLDEEMLSALWRMQQGSHIGNLSWPCFSPRRPDVQFSQPSCFVDQINSPWEHANNVTLNNLQLRADSAFGRSSYHRGIRVPNVIPSLIRPSANDSFLFSQQNGINSSGDRVALNSPSSHLTHLKLPSGVDNQLGYTIPILNRRAGEIPNSWAAQSVPSMRNMHDLEAFNCEDSIIIQGKGLNYVINKGNDHSRGHKKGCGNAIVTGHLWDKSSELDGQFRSGGIPTMSSENGCSPRIYCPFLPPKYNSLLEVQGYIYFIAKDQHGCRFLQRIFDEGTPRDVQIIFNEIINHVVELMMNPFGNYLMQKLLDVCNEEQRMEILLMVTEEPGELVKISLNTHGTRAVQKLIETLRTRKEISMVISALEPGFLHLIKDLNGNHVVSRCLQCLSTEDNKFIFDAAANFCVDIATHRHGCCVLQRCIAHSTGEHREKLVAGISANGLLLAQDAFGNYVVQYVLELKIPSATTNLISQFEGNYVHLSTQKFSSNVVEKCLKVFGEENRSRIIHELLSSPQFEHLLQDPFANYVIQSALLVSKGPLHASLVDAIRPHASILRTSPYCKRIFSRALLKK